MAEVNYKPQWDDPSSQCQKCQFYHSQDGKNACVPPGKNFGDALKTFGEVSPSGHCDYFTKK